MGTITEKFAYLKETKALIKSALIEKGQTVSDTDTFRSYAEKVLAIQGGGGSSVVDILPEQELAFVDDPSSGFPALNGFNLFNLINLMLGETYTVVWGDQTFKCECFEGTMGGLPIIGIGNPAAIGGANNGLPFAFGVVTAEGDYNGYCMIASLDGSYSKKVHVYHEASAGVQDERVKYVTFIGLGGVELYRQPVIVGDTCRNPVDKNYIETPTKESTVSQVFTYNGWSLAEGGSASSSALTNVTEDRTVYAAFTSAARKYTITYYDDDGVTVLATKSVAYGSTPSYVPSKTGYSLVGWQPEIVSVTGDASYVAQWEEKITFAGSSWADIIAASEAGKAQTMFAIGDTRTEMLGDETVTYTIVGFDQDTKYFSSEKDPHISIMSSVLATNKKMFSSTISYTTSTERKYTESDIYSFLNNTVYSLLPDELRNGIKRVTKIHYSTKQSSSQSYTSAMRLWLPIYMEVNYSYSGTTWFKYSYFTTRAKAIGYKADGTASSYWTRQGSSGADKFTAVTESGTSNNYTVTAEHGVRFGFCI